MPALDGSDDFVGIRFPDERAWFLIMFHDEAVDGGLQVDDGVKHAVFEASPGWLCEEAPDGIEP